MELIVINDSKLKVMLSQDDLTEFSLDTNTLDYSNSETKKMFWDILNRAKHTLGFSTDGHRVLVQLYPSKTGGCEMFVTKLGLLPPDCFDSFCGEKENTDKKQIFHYKASHRRPKGESRRGVFGFDELSSLIGVCRRLRNIGYDGQSAAYRCEGKKYYLFLEGLDLFGFMPPDEFTFINEFGKAENPEAVSYYISEHGNTICASDAVNVLGVL